MDEKIAPENGSVSGGLYILMNKASRTVLDLHDGNSGNGTKIRGQSRRYDEWFLHFVWLIRQNGPDGTYTLKNVKSNTVLDLAGGNKGDNAETQGWKHYDDQANQHWKIQREGVGFFTLQNPRAGTFLGIKAGSTADGTPAVCSSFRQGDDARLWELERVSRTADEILNVIGKWDESFLPRLCLPHAGDAQYFVLPNVLRNSIWTNTNLRRQHIRRYIFDYEDFVIKTKDAATTWGRDNVKIDGFSVLFGILYGNASKGPKAYNWYLSPDMHAIVFFDAQTGREYTALALEEAEFKPSFGIF